MTTLWLGLLVRVLASVAAEVAEVDRDRAASFAGCRRSGRRRSCRRGRRRGRDRRRGDRRRGDRRGAVTVATAPAGRRRARDRRERADERERERRAPTTSRRPTPFALRLVRVAVTEPLPGSVTLSDGRCGPAVWSSIAFHAGVGPVGPCEGAVHWLSAISSSISSRSASASFVIWWSVTPTTMRLVAGAHDRDRRVPPERAPRDRRRSCTPGPPRRADAADAAPAHDARREPHQADDDPEREDQAGEQRERRRRSTSGRAHRLRGDDLRDADAELFVDHDDFAARDQRAVDEHVDRACRRRGRAR